MKVQTSKLTIRIPENLRKRLEREAKVEEIKLSRLIRNRLAKEGGINPYLYINDNLKIPFDQLGNARVIFE